MSKIATEATNGKADGLDRLPPAAVLERLAAGQQEAARAVDKALSSLARAAELVADTLRDGHRLVYVGAGSSGLMAMADALELPGTYSIPREQIVLLLAGGMSSLTNMEGAPEDDLLLAEQDAAAIASTDCVICVSASGFTPYAVAIADQAKARGAKVIAMANNSNAKLFHEADIRILLETPPELVAGSTRMGAGTAQKIALNMLSTLAAIKLGHVHDGHMVNLRADNEKLRARAAGMVSEIAGVEIEKAGEWLGKAGGSVKLAILLAAGASDLAAAQALLLRTQQVLRPALAELGHSTSSIKRA
jgi:N-acetylmuramic acid 6-phosphate etherase